MLALLRENAVDTLIDVRRFPGSKRNPQFNQDAITAALPHDISYRWLLGLGGRRYSPKDAASENDGWRVKAFRDYADHMQSDEFKEALAELIDLAGHASPAIMCSEAVPWRCHRRLITDALIVAGLEVRHIMSVGATKPATLTDFARVEDGRITYPAPR